jgi:hypothetical protein
MSFGHAAAMIDSEEDSASAKQRMLRAAGVEIAQSLADIPSILAGLGFSPSEENEPVRDSRQARTNKQEAERMVS